MVDKANCLCECRCMVQSHGAESWFRTAFHLSKQADNICAGEEQTLNQTQLNKIVKASQ